MKSEIDWHKRYQTQARWTRQLREHLYQGQHLNESSRILEVGCGTGVITHELSQKFMTRVTGIDIDFTATLQASRNANKSRFAVANGLQLPFPDARFGLTVSHFYLLWVNDPLAAILEMRRVTRQGGAIMALAEPDYGGRIDYPPSLEKLGYYQTQALIKQDANPYIGRRLADLFQRSGLIDVETGVLGGQWSFPLDTLEAESEWEVLQSDLIEFINAKDLQNFKELDEAARRSGNRILFVPTFYAVGNIK